MALVQIEYPVNLSTQADFSKHGDLIESGLWDKVDKPLLVRDGVIPQGVVLQIGSDIYHATSDTAITGTASDYVEVTPDGTGGADAAYVATLTGVTWNAQYNGYYNATATKLYLFDEGKAFAVGAVGALFSRYLQQQANGDVQVARDMYTGRDVIVSRDVNVSGDVALANDPTDETHAIRKSWADARFMRFLTSTSSGSLSGNETKGITAPGDIVGTSVDGTDVDTVYVTGANDSSSGRFRHVINNAKVNSRSYTVYWRRILIGI